MLDSFAVPLLEKRKRSTAGLCLKSQSGEDKRWKTDNWTPAKVNWKEWRKDCGSKRHQPECCSTGDEKLFFNCLKSCIAALGPKKIPAAVQQITEKNDRSQNVIVYGIYEGKMTTSKTRYLIS